MNLRKVWEIKGNTKKSREILGYFSSGLYDKWIYVEGKNALKVKMT